MAEAIRKTLDAFMVCSICTDVYKDPRTLPCLHTFCLVCCEGFCRDKVPDDEVDCPLCREPFVIPPSGVSGLKKNFDFGSLIEQLNKLSVGRQGKTDSLVPRTSLPIFCGEHKNMTLDWYCVECKEPACAYCKAKCPPSHNVVVVETVANDLRSSLASDVTTLSNIYEKCELSLNEIDSENEKFMKDINKVEAEISREAKRLQELIERNKSKLLAEVSAKKRDRLKKVANSTREIRQEMAFFSSLKSYTTELVNNGSVRELAREANSLGKLVRNTLEMQKFRTAENKSNSVRLGFVPCNDTEIGNLIESRELCEDVSRTGVAVSCRESNDEDSVVIYRCRDERGLSLFRTNDGGIAAKIKTEKFVTEVTATITGNGQFTASTRGYYVHDRRLFISGEKLSVNVKFHHDVDVANGIKWGVCRGEIKNKDGKQKAIVQMDPDFRGRYKIESLENEAVVIACRESDITTVYGKSGEDSKLQLAIDLSEISIQRQRMAITLT